MGLKTNRKFKDTLFRKIFSNKKDLLSLYNALNGTEYTDENMIVLNTIEDVILKEIRTEISIDRVFLEY